MAQIIDINGSPALFFDALPNWRNPVSRTWEYKTELFTSYTDVEQRRALRSTPRQGFSLTVTHGPKDFEEFITLLAGWQRRLFLLPDPVRWIVLEQALNPAGVSVLLTNGAPPWLVEGTRVALDYRGQRMAYRRVASVQGSEVIFDSFDDQTWPPGTRVRLLYQARLLSGVPSKLYTQQVIESVLDFSVEPTTEKYVPQSGIDTYFDGLEVWYKRPNWIAPIDVNTDAVFEQLDFDRGARLVTTPSGYSARTQKLQFLNRGWSEADLFEAFFHRMKGRRGTFYMPTWSHDLEPISPLVAGGNQMVVEPLSVAQMLLNDPANRRLSVMTKDGQVYHNKVLDYKITQGGYGYDWGFSYGSTIALGDRRTLMTLRDPWPVTVNPENIVRVSWLMACRMASDTLTYTYQTPTVAQVGLTVKQIKDADESTRIRYGWGLSYGMEYGGAA